MWVTDRKRRCMLLLNVQEGFKGFSSIMAGNNIYFFLQFNLSSGLSKRRIFYMCHNSFSPHSSQTEVTKISEDVCKRYRGFKIHIHIYNFNTF